MDHTFVQSLWHLAILHILYLKLCPSPLPIIHHIYSYYIPGAFLLYTLYLTFLISLLPFYFSFLSTPSALSKTCYSLIASTSPFVTIKTFFFFFVKYYLHLLGTSCTSVTRIFPLPTPHNLFYLLLSLSTKTILNLLMK